MVYEDVNELLRIMTRKVISLGFKKTNIGRTIFGASSYPMFLRFINPEEEKDFGIKPLQRAAEVLGYEARVIFVDPNKTEDPILEEIDNKNKQFVLSLEDYLVNYLGKAGEEKRTRSSSLDVAVDNLLGIAPDFDDDDQPLL